MSTDTKGKHQNVRTDARYYARIYDNQAPTLQLADQDFRFIILRPDRTNFPITALVESAEWRDEGNSLGFLNEIPVLRGEMTLRKPAYSDPLSKIQITDGYVVLCQVNWGGRWRECWRMRIQQTATGVGDGTLTLTLADDLALLAKSRYDYKFKQGKTSHKKGYRYWEIVRAVCRQSKVRLDTKMPKGHRWIKNFSQKQISPLEAIRQAVQMEEDWTGRPHLIYWRDNRIHIKPLRRNPLLYILSNQLRAADITVGRKAQAFTSVTATGKGKVTKKKNGESKKVTKKYARDAVNRKAVKRFGLIHGQVNLGDHIDSQDEMKKLTKRALAKAIRPHRVLENVSHYGIALVRRGDAVKVLLPEEGIQGRSAILFVASVTHNLTGGDYTMDLTLTLIDPSDPNTLRQKREEAARRRKRGEKGKDHKTKGHLVGASVFDDSTGYHGDSLNSVMAYAELGGTDEGSAHNLGGLPYKHALKITYKGKSVVAKKYDIGLGGGPVKGHRRDIDLHRKVADAIGFHDGLDLVTIEDA